MLKSPVTTPSVWVLEQGYMSHTGSLSPPGNLFWGRKLFSQVAVEGNNQTTSKVFKEGGIFKSSLLNCICAFPTPGKKLRESK